MVGWVCCRDIVWVVDVGYVVRLLLGCLLLVMVELMGRWDWMFGKGDWWGVLWWWVEVRGLVVMSSCCWV